MVGEYLDYTHRPVADQVNERLSNDRQPEQWEKLSGNLLSRWNYRYAVKQRLVCSRAHAIPHHIDDCGPAGTVRVIGE